MIDLVTFLALCLATWRISSLLADEIGPWDVFVKLRELTGITHDESKRILTIPFHFLPQLISCVWCNSIWVGAGWTTLWAAMGRYVLIPALPFALSAFAIWMDKR